MLEGRGLTTVSISLVRRHTEMLRPPRALYVPFPFGMAVGHPGDVAQQPRVLDALFATLDATPPVLHDLTGEATETPMSPTQASVMGSAPTPTTRPTSPPRSAACGTTSSAGSTAPGRRRLA